MYTSNTSSNIVYHYCSVNSFFNIIKTKTLRLGDIEKSNDSMEKSLVIMTIIKLLENEPDKYCDSSVINTITGTRKILEKYHDVHSYVCCFSEEKDSLSQWRGYADEACGVAIGIDKLLVDFESPRYQFFKVSYDQKKLEADCKRIINAAIEKTAPLFHYNNAENLFINLQDHYRDIFLKYKNNAFQYENEWRIVVNAGTMIQLEPDKLCVMNIDNPEAPGNIKFSKLQHYVINNQVKSYIDLIFEDVKNEIIKEIWLGPRCKNSEEDIYILLNECGYDVETMYKNGFRVHRSSASYR